MVLILSFSTQGCLEDHKYTITENYILSIYEIDSFSIAEIEVTDIGENGIPYNYQEIARVTCESNLGTDRKIFFHKENAGYSWTFSNLDLRFVEADSLKDLSVEEKLRILRDEGAFDGEVTHFKTMPLKFDIGKWFHLFGLKNIQGSYFIFVKPDGSLLVRYFDGGPF